MRARWIATGFIAIVIAVAVAALEGSAPRPLGPHPVVVELFTSQG